MFYRLLPARAVQTDVRTAETQHMESSTWRSPSYEGLFSRVNWPSDLGVLLPSCLFPVIFCAFIDNREKSLLIAYLPLQGKVWGDTDTTEWLFCHIHTPPTGQGVYLLHCAEWWWESACPLQLIRNLEKLSNGKPYGFVKWATKVLRAERWIGCVAERQSCK